MQLMGKNMIEYIRTHFFQQLVLGLEVRIKCASPDICLIQYLLNGNIIEMLFFQQPVKSPEDRSPCFLLSSIHVKPPNKMPFLFSNEQPHTSGYCYPTNFPL
jgi:hypothetical protein